MQLLSARRLKFLSLALLMSGGTVVLTQQWLHQAVRRASDEASAKAMPSAPASASQVLVAAETLPAGTILKSGQVRWQAWPAGAATNGYMTQANTRMDHVAGSVVRTNVEAGEPLTLARVVQPGDRGFLAAVLRPGYRAVTINVSAATGVGGFALPGDHVDLILSLPAQSPAAGGRGESVTVLQDVRVLAMDQRAGEPKDAKKDEGKKDVTPPPQTATLEVTPKGAEIVTASLQAGPLSLSLRSLAEPQTPAPFARDVTHTSLGEALGLPKAPPPARVAAPRHAAPRVAGVELFRGSQAVMVPTASSEGGGR